MVEKAATQNSGREYPRFIAFYLPQFYPTPYNDAWWGKGFTEWNNVVKGRPRFRGHYQPHLPADLGFYDLRLSETREAQAELATQFGVYGFCYYHYWFSGKRILERPLDEVLASGKPGFPFCICWANETWKKSWIGRNTVTLLEQTFSFEDDLAHIRHLLPVLADSRYIRIEGRPLLLVYRVELLPEPRRTAEIWRNEAIKAGLGDLFLVNVQSTYLPQGTSPDTVAFDAAVRFEPRAQPAAPTIVRAWRTLKSPIHNDRFTHYKQLYRHWKDAPQPLYRHFECVTPMWDNTARRPRRAGIVHGSTPELYERWLAHAVERSTPDRDHQRWVFINAWNEWGEGCHLEPCQKWGTAYLEATQRVYQQTAAE
jgi:lipopolysaccharide biosynthesis protein